MAVLQRPPSSESARVLTHKANKVTRQNNIHNAKVATQAAIINQPPATISAQIITFNATRNAELNAEGTTAP